ncbi:MAG TPA: DUF4157 domain-containing protein [Fluviicola sp.]|nr:DUF4157 domain-containing protein [Fluviicola sp.]
MEAVKKVHSSSAHSHKSDGRTPFLGIQAKLNVNKPGDKYEVEADQAAEQVVSKKTTPTPAFVPSTSPVQLKEDDQPVVQEKSIASSVTPYVQAKEDEPAQMMEEEQAQAQEEEVQAKEDDLQAKEDEPAQMMEEEPAQAQEEEAQAKEDDLQAKEDEPAQMMEEEPAQAQEEEAQAQEDDEVQTKLQPSVPKPSSAPTINDKLRSSKGSGSALPEGVKSEMESGFGADFSNVKVHTDDRAASMSKEIGAQAFTNKGDIYFNQGKFNPASGQGKTLLAHELTHTIQQGASTPKDADKKEETQAAQEEKATETSPQTGSAAAQPGTAQPVPNGNQQVAASGQTGTSATSPSMDPSVSLPAPTPVPEAAPSTQPVTAADVKADQQATGEQIPEGEVVEEEKQLPSPEQDPNFLAVTGAIAKESDAQESKEDPDELSEDASAAAKSPDNEAESFAMAEQVDEMEQQEPKEFSAENFKKLLSARIAEMQLPENNDEADKFEQENNIDEVNKKATGDVQAETAATSGAIDQSTNKDPNVKPEHKRKEEELPPVRQSKKPKNVNAQQAVPQARPATDVEQPLADDTARMDNAMAENEVTDHQLEISQEPKFEQALGEKNKAKEESAKISQTVRTDESSVLQKNAAKSQKMGQEELQGMKILNDQSVKKVTGDQKATGGKDTSERERVAGEINKIYDKTKTDVNKILDDLDAKVETDFAAASEKAKARFEKYCGDKMAQYKYDRYLSQVGGWALWTYDLFAGLPDEVNQFYVDGRELFVETMDAEVDKIAHHIAGELNRATQRIETGKQEVNDYVDKLPKNLKQYGKEAAEAIREKFDELSEEVNAKEEELVDMLAEEYVASLKEVDERIEELKAANRGLIDMAMDFINGVIETIRKLKEAIMGLLSAIASAISVIMADPIGFMGNLFDGIGQGIDLFKTNIQKHLLGGLLEWLTGAMGPMGITVPEDIFSLSGIFNLVMQVLGLGWDMLRMKAVKAMGEPTVNALETGADAGFSIFKAMRSGGIMGLWEFAKEKFTDLKETIIDAIKEMLITKVIEAGIKWLLSLLIPGAGFIKAIMAIKDIIVFFVETAIMLIPAITEAILALASGSVAGVAKAFEFGLSKLIVLVIGLFAKLIGLGDLAKRVQKIFKKIRKRVDKVVRDLLKKAKRAGRKLMRKLGLGKKKKKGDKDSRTDKEMKADLNKGIQEGTSFVKQGGHDQKEIKKQFGKIEKKYELVELKLVVDKENPEAKDKVHVQGEVNPKDNSPIFEVELEGDSVSTPPPGRAYLVKQEYSYGMHYVAYLSNGDLFHLGYDEKKKNAHGDPIITISSKTMKSLKAVKAVSVPAEDVGTEELNKKFRTKVNGKIEQYKGEGYKITVNDCLVFSLDILNNVFNAGVPVPKKGEDYDVWFNGLTKK